MAWCVLFIRLPQSSLRLVEHSPEVGILLLLLSKLLLLFLLLLLLLLHGALQLMQLVSHFMGMLLLLLQLCEHCRCELHTAHEHSC